MRKLAGCSQRNLERETLQELPETQGRGEFHEFSYFQKRRKDKEIGPVIQAAKKMKDGQGLRLEFRFKFVGRQKHERPKPKATRTTRVLERRS